MSRFTGGDPTRIHLLDRDSEFLIELPSAVQILRILASHATTAARVTPDTSLPRRIGSQRVKAGDPTCFTYRAAEKRTRNRLRGG